MNNKLIKLVAVVVLSVMALGTCAFASEIAENPTYTKESALISFDLEPAAGATQMTYVAYAGNTGGTILAIDQIDAEAKTVNVTIDADKIGDAEQIVLNSGDDVSDTRDQETISLSEAVVGKSVFTNKDDELKSVTVNGVTYKNVPLFSVAVTTTKASEKTFTVTGLVAKATGMEDHALKLSEGCAWPSIKGETTFTIDNIYLIGAPAEFINAPDAEIVPTWTLN